MGRVCGLTIKDREEFGHWEGDLVTINSWKLNSILQECHSELNISNKKK